MNYNNGVLLSVQTPGTNTGGYFTTSYRIDGFGETNRVTLDDGSRIYYQYNPAGILTSVVQGNRTNRFLYTTDGDLAAKIYPDGHSDTNEYYESGLLKTVSTVTNGVQCRRTKYYYVDDNKVFGSVRKTVRFDGITVQEYLDAAGRTTNRTETAGGLTRSLYTAYGYEAGLGSPNRSFTESWKDNKIEWTHESRDFRGNTVAEEKSFDGINLVTVMSRAYNLDGALTSEERDYSAIGSSINHSDTYYAYNTSGTLASRTDPSGLTVSFTYDKAGKVITKTESGGGMNRVTQYSYLPNGQAGNVQTGDSSTVLRSESYSYDCRGNAVSQRDDLLKTEVKKVYDQYGNKTSETLLTNGSQYSARNYVYDIAGREIININELGGTNISVYDGLGNLIQTIKPSAAILDSGPDDLKTSYYYDQNGRTTNVSVDGWTLSSMNPVNVIYTASTSYDAWGNTVQSTDPGGNVTKASYDNWGRKTSSTDRLGYSTSYSYDLQGQEAGRTSETPGGKLVITNGYDYSGRTISQSTQDLTTRIIRATHTDYDADGNILTNTWLIAGNNTNLTETYGYDAFGNKTSVTDPLGHTSRANYDVLGRKINTTDRMQRTTTFGYATSGYGSQIVTTIQNGGSIAITNIAETDGAGNRVRSTDPDGYSETAQYNAMGKPLAVTDRRGYTNYTDYDVYGRPTASRDPYGLAIRTDYDTFGNGVKITDKLGTPLYHAFDWSGRTIQTTDALGNVSSTKYYITTTPNGSAFCEAAEYKDALGHVSTTYQAGKLTLAFEDTLGNFTRYSHDAFGELTETIDPNGNHTRLTYDVRGLKTSETTALGNTTTYVYDDAGNLIKEFNGVGSISTAYNSEGQPTLKQYYKGILSPIQENEKDFGYDNLGRLNYAADNSSKYSYGYDSAGNLLTRTDNKNGEQLAYTYYPTGYRASMTATTSGSTKVTSYRYDYSGQITLETVRTAGTTNLQISYAYNAMGRLTNKTASTGLTSFMTYDTIYRLTRIENRTNGGPSVQSPGGDHSGTGQLFSSLDYTYDNIGNRTQETATSGPSVQSPNGDHSGTGTSVIVTAFVYDNAYRLIQANYGQDRAEAYSYDSCGNRLTKATTVWLHSSSGNVTNTTVENINYTFDNDNRLMLEQHSTGSPSAPARGPEHSLYL